jgi:hypothetical protein
MGLEVSIGVTGFRAIRGRAQWPRKEVAEYGSFVHSCYHFKKVIAKGLVVFQALGQLAVERGLDGLGSSSR